jgi:hypothetical protein
MINRKAPLSSADDNEEVSRLTVGLKESSLTTDLRAHICEDTL